MKKIIGGLLLSSVLAAPVLANAGPMARPCPPCNGGIPYVKWGGWKMGAQFGWGQGTLGAKVAATNQTTRLVTFERSRKIGFKGPVYGFHGGYDFQFLRYWILGVEMAMDWHNFNEDIHASDVFGNRWDAEYKSKWTFALVPRIGYGLRDSLFYAGLGWGCTGAKVKGSVFNTRVKHVGKASNGVRFAAGVAQRLNRILLGFETTYDVYEKNSKRRFMTVDNTVYAVKSTLKPQVLEARIKFTYLL